MLEVTSVIRDNGIAKAVTIKDESNGTWFKATFIIDENRKVKALNRSSSKIGNADIPYPIFKEKQRRAYAIIFEKQTHH